MKTESNYKKTEAPVQDYQSVPAEETRQETKGTLEKDSDTLVFLNERRKKRIDETIDTPEKYLSRYHYDTKNLDKYLDLCPHCRKPTLATFRRVVIDSALGYLEEKADQRNRKSTLRLCASVTAGVLLISAGLYFLLFHVLAEVKI